MTGAAVAAAIKGTSCRKPAGADGWTYAALQAWHPDLCEALAAFYSLVERIGRWPNKLRLNKVALLPEGGSRDALDRRPIFLLPLALHAKQMRDWLPRAGVLRWGAGSAADEHAADLGVDVDLVHADRVELAGLALDWSMCYIHVPLFLLEQLALRVGLPAAVWRPMLSAHAAPHFVVADGTSGDAVVPIRGLAPGCPAATHWLALLTHCLRGALAWASRMRSTERVRRGLRSTHSVACGVSGSGPWSRPHAALHRKPCLACSGSLGAAMSRPWGRSPLAKPAAQMGTA